MKNVHQKCSKMAIIMEVSTTLEPLSQVSLYLALSFYQQNHPVMVLSIYSPSLIGDNYTISTNHVDVLQVDCGV